MSWNAARTKGKVKYTIGVFFQCTCITAENGFGNGGMLFKDCMVCLLKCNLTP